MQAAEKWCSTVLQYVNAPGAVHQCIYRYKRAVSDLKTMICLYFTSDRSLGGQSQLGLATCSTGICIWGRRTSGIGHICIAIIGTADSDKCRCVKPEGTYGDVKCPSRRPPTTGS